MSTIVTTDVDDSFAIFQHKSGVYEVRPVSPSGRVGFPVDIFESKEAAEDLRRNLVKHVEEWVNL